MADDFVNFDNALNELGMSAEQLKRLVSEGQIRAVRGENDSMRFRRDELERLKQQAGGSDESSDTLTDDLLFDEADDLDLGDEGMATAQISSEDTLVGDDDGLTTAPIAPASGPRGGRRGTGKRGGKGAAKGGGAKRPAPAPAPTAQQTSVRRTTGRSTRMRQADVASAKGIGIGMTVVMGLTTVLALYASLVWLDIPTETTSSVTDGIAKQMVNSFAEQAKPK